MRKENTLKVLFNEKTKANSRFHSEYTEKLPFMKCLSAANRNLGIVTVSPIGK